MTSNTDNKDAADWVKNSRAHKKAQSKAKEYAESPDKLDDLVDRATKKANGKKGPLSSVWVQLMASFRLLRAYAKGRYRQIPWQSLMMIIASVVYFVMPLDFLPDFLLGFGYLDDAALLGWTLKAINSDIDKFLAWEEEQVEGRSEEDTL